MYEKQHLSDIFGQLVGLYLNKIIFLLSEMDPTNFIVNWCGPTDNSRVNQLCVGFNIIKTPMFVTVEYVSDLKGAATCVLDI